jgi:hypothetical protein
MLDSPAGLLPLPRRALGPLSVPCRPGTPAYKLYVKMKGKTCARTHPRVHDIGLCHPTRAAQVPPAPTAWLGAAQVPPCVPWPQLLSPGSGQLRCCHASRGASSRLLAQGSSRAATCPVALAPTSWLKVALKPHMCPMVLYGLWAIEVSKYPPVVLPS